MSALTDYLSQKKIKPQTLLNKSAALELATLEDIAALAKRAEHRAKNQNNNYGEGGLTKPTHTGRALTKRQLDAFLAGGFGSKRGRGKLVRALAAITSDDAANLRKLVTPALGKKSE